MEGELNRNAASVCMAALYAGRLARFDLLRAIQRLAEIFHKWTKRHSQKLHRLMEYINSHLHHKQYGFISDPWEDLELVEFVDADWASDNLDKKSTAGALLRSDGVRAFVNNYFINAPSLRTVACQTPRQKRRAPRA